jgi:cysteine desulfurase
LTERVYLDWNATTPLRIEARQAMVAALDLAGNPSSVHLEGRAARRLVEEARQRVAQAIGASERNVIFTSGGTEANAFALQPDLVGRDAKPLRRLVVSAIEHVSVLSGGRFARGAIELAPVTPDGAVDLNGLRAMLVGKPPALVSIMLANNETGVIQPVRPAADIVHEAGGLLHVDAVQGLGKIGIDIGALGADIISLSAHKLGGPKGVGAIVLSDELQTVAPLIRGGGQERNRRAGTENVAAIAGFGAAVTAAQADVTIFGVRSQRLPNTTLFAAPGMRAETAVIAFDLEGIAVSSGSACSSGKVTPSHVLKAMGAPLEITQGAIRLSTGYLTSEPDIQRSVEAWRKLSGVLGKR